MVRLIQGPLNFDLSNTNWGKNFSSVVDTSLKMAGAKSLWDASQDNGRKGRREQLQLRRETTKAFRDREINMTQHIDELAESGASAKYIEESLRESNRKYKGLNLSDPNTDVKVTKTGHNWFGYGRRAKVTIAKKPRKDGIDKTVEVNYKETNLNPNIMFTKQSQVDLVPFKLQQYTPVDDKTDTDSSQFDESCVVEVTATYNDPILESPGGKVLAVVLLFVFITLVSRFTKWIEFQIQRFTRQKDIIEIINSYNNANISWSQAFNLLLMHRVHPYEIENLLGPEVNRLNQ